MGVLRVGICDDGSAICSEIERIVKEYGKKHDLRLDTEMWSTGEALVDYLEDGNAIDLLFLDIDLITTSGVDIGQYIRHRLNNYSMEIVFMCLLRRIMQSRNEQQIVPSVALIIVPIISICILLYMAYMKHYISGDFIAVGLGLLCINFLVLYLYNMLLESAQEKYENQILRQYVKEYSNQLDIILESEQKVRRMRHDIRNHLSEIQLLTMQNKRDEVLKYIESMTDYMQNSRAISESGNIETAF